MYGSNERIPDNQMIDNGHEVELQTRNGIRYGMTKTEQQNVSVQFSIQNDLRREIVEINCVSKCCIHMYSSSFNKITTNDEWNPEWLHFPIRFGLTSRQSIRKCI